MSMFDTVEIADESPFNEEICQEEWQVKIERTGASYRITADMTLEVRTLQLKEGVELGDKGPKPDDLTREWTQTEYSGPLRLTGHKGQLDLVLEEGEIVDFDPTVVSLV